MYPTPFCFGVLHQVTYVSHHGTFIIASIRTFRVLFIIIYLFLCITLCFIYFILSQCSKVQFSCSVMSDSLQPHEAQHTRSPCSPTPGVHSNSCPLSPWCHSAISSSVVPFSSCPLSLPSSGSFPMSQLFTWSCQSTGVSGLASILAMKTQDWSPLWWTKGLSRGFSKPQFQSINSSALAFFTVQLSHSSMSTGKTIALTRRAIVGKVMLSRLVITLPPTSKCLNFMAAITICNDFGAPKIKSDTVSTISPSISH